LRKIFEDKEKQRLFEATLQSINKDFGTSGSQILGDNKVDKLPRTSSGSYKIDELVGGGYPDGRIIEIYGEPSSGKSTLSLHFVAEVQKKGKLAVYIDSENALDVNYAKALGVNVEDLVVAQPDSAEDCLQVAERWVNSGLAGCVIVDSVAALVPEAEIKGDIGDNHVGVLARLMSQALRKLAYACNKTGTTMLFVNQTREKIGVLFGNPTTTTGGKALPFYSSIRIEVRPTEITKTEGVATSRKTKIKIVKNKVAPPFREDTIDIEFGEGISKTGEILDYGTELGILQKKGSWYWYGEERIGNGRDACKKILKENDELRNELDRKIRLYLNPESEDYIPTTKEELEESFISDNSEV